MNMHPSWFILVINAKLHHFLSWHFVVNELRKLKKNQSVLTVFENYSKMSHFTTLRAKRAIKMIFEFSRQKSTLESKDTKDTTLTILARKFKYFKNNDTNRSNCIFSMKIQMRHFRSFSNTVPCVRWEAVDGVCHLAGAFKKTFFSMLSSLRMHR